MGFPTWLSPARFLCIIHTKPKYFRVTSKFFNSKISLSVWQHGFPLMTNRRARTNCSMITWSLPFSEEALPWLLCPVWIVCYYRVYLPQTFPLRCFHYLQNLSQTETQMEVIGSMQTTWRQEKYTSHIKSVAMWLQIDLVLNLNWEIYQFCYRHFWLCKPKSSRSLPCSQWIPSELRHVWKWPESISQYLRSYQ